MFFRYTITTYYHRPKKFRRFARSTSCNIFVPQMTICSFSLRSIRSTGSSYAPLLRSRGVSAHAQIASGYRVVSPQLFSCASLNNFLSFLLTIQNVQGSTGKDILSSLEHRWQLSVVPLSYVGEQVAPLLLHYASS